MFKSTLSARTRGHSWKLQEQHQPGPRKAFYPARATPAWNGLSEETVGAPSVNTFKTRLAKERRLQASQYEYHFSY